MYIHVLRTSVDEMLHLICTDTHNYLRANLPAWLRQTLKLMHEPNDLIAYLHDFPLAVNKGPPGGLQLYLRVYII